MLVTGPGPYYAPLAELEHDRGQLDWDHHIWLPVAVAQQAVGRVRPGGTLLFMAGTRGGGRGPGLSLIAANSAALPALVANLAVEIAPIRVNLIAAGFVDSPLSATLLGADLDKRRAQLRATLPIRRVVEPADVAALAVHLMSNTAVTGATYDIDGGQQLLPGELRGPGSASRHHHRRLQGHRRRPGGRVPRARLGGGGQRPQDQAVGSR